MNPNLKWKVIFIVLVVVGCIYGLIGLPVFPTSLAQIKDNFAHQIKLGLDLQGGTHLILQVQTQEAIAQETDQTVDRLTTQLRAKNIRYDEIRRTDAPDHSSDFRDLISQQLQNVWDLSPAAGEQNSYTLTLRANAVAQLRESTMTQSIETIER